MGESGCGCGEEGGRRRWRDADVEARPTRDKPRTSPRGLRDGPSAVIERYNTAVHSQPTNNVTKALAVHMLEAINLLQVNNKNIVNEDSNLNCNTNV